MATRARKRPKTKIQKIMEYLHENPDAKAREIQDLFKAASSQVSVARRRLGIRAEQGGNNGRRANPVPEPAKAPDDVYSDICEEAVADIAKLKQIGFHRVRAAMAIVDLLGS